MPTNFLRPLFLIALLIFSVSPAWASQADLDAEISSYVEAFQGPSFEAKRKIMERMEWSGHTSTKLFDSIEVALNDSLAQSGKDAKKQSMWYIKTLALSGEPKYRTVLSDLAENADSKKVAKRAKAELVRWEKYQRWNSVIAAGLDKAPAGRLEQTRVENMLNASDPELLRIGAKRLFREFLSDGALVSIGTQRLEKEAQNIDSNDGHQIDAIAWLIKSVGDSGGEPGKRLLSQIAENTKIKKVRKYAKKYVD